MEQKDAGTWNALVIITQSEGSRFMCAHVCFFIQAQTIHVINTSTSSLADIYFSVQMESLAFKKVKNANWVLGENPSLWVDSAKHISLWPLSHLRNSLDVLYKHPYAWKRTVPSAEPEIWSRLRKREVWTRSQERRLVWTGRKQNVLFMEVLRALPLFCLELGSGLQVHVLN